GDARAGHLWGGSSPHRLRLRSSRPRALLASAGPAPCPSPIFDGRGVPFVDSKALFAKRQVLAPSCSWPRARDTLPHTVPLLPTAMAAVRPSAGEKGPEDEGHEMR